MNVLILVLIVMITLYLLDANITRIYCKIQRTKDISTEPKHQYTTEEVLNYRGFKKIIKYIFHVYKGWIRYKLYRLGKVPCHAYRKFILRHIYLLNIANTAVLYGGFEIRAPWNISIGEGTIIGDESKLDGRNGLTIGKNVNFSTGVWIWTELDDRFFMYCEDLEYSLRAYKQGITIDYIPDAKLWHKVGASSAPHSALNVYYDTRNRLMIMKEYKFSVKSYCYVLSSRLIRLIQGIFKKNNNNIYIWKGLLDYLKGKTGKAELV